METPFRQTPRNNDFRLDTERTLQEDTFLEANPQNLLKFLERDLTDDEIRFCE